ncbi:MAG TPA: PorV/PorQ family protein [Candidatus Wallbacteria bacterium]|nr:PorV/PorQ family protein [Candidatus Wallbacteria bacterium]
MAILYQKKMKKRRKNRVRVMLWLFMAVFMGAFIVSGLLSFARAYSNPDFFLKQGVGARQLGMGNAGTAVADDASAVFFNPAGLAFLKNLELTSMHSEAYDFDIKYDYLNLILPIIHGRVIGVAGAVLKTDQIPITKDKIPNIVNYVEDKEQVAMISYGHKISRQAAIGFTYKDIKHYLYFKEAVGSEADFGILYNPSKTISLGLNVQDFLPGELKWSTGVTDSIPLTLRGGIAFKLPDWGSIITFDADKVQDRDVKLNGGWEYQFNETFLGRAGVNDGQATAGFSIMKYGWRFDYAYMKAELGEVQRFSGTTRFGSYLFENLWKRFKRPREPQCGEMKITSNAKCDKLSTPGHDCKTGDCSKPNPGSKLASYPSAGSRKDVALAKDVMAPQPDINKVLAKDQSPVVQIPRSANLRLPDEKMKEGNKMVLAGRYDEAAKAFREALNMKPNLEEAHTKLAGIYQYQKLYVEAIEEYKDAIAINPSNPDNYISVSSLYAKIGEFEKAAEACEIVIRMAPGTPKAKTAQNLYETFKRQSAPSDDKLLLRADNIQSLNFEDVADAQLKLDISEDKPVKKSAKKTASKKSASKAKAKKDGEKSAKSDDKNSSSKKASAIGKVASAKPDILEE